MDPGLLLFSAPAVVRGGGPWLAVVVSCRHGQWWSVADGGGLWLIIGLGTSCG